LKEYSAVLKDNPLFKGLNEDDISRLLKSLRAKVALKDSGEYIFYAGDKTSSMGIVLSGSVLIVQEDVWGHRNIMSRISSGDIFAEVFASAREAVLNVSALADSRCEILLINVQNLLSYSQNDIGYNTVIKNLVSLIAKKTMAFNDKITHISKRTTRDKLLSFLSSEAIKRGTLSFNIAYNRQQLADYLCVERAAMCVELSKLKTDGLLKYRKNHFKLTKIAEV